MTEKQLEDNKIIAEFIEVKTKVYSDTPTITTYNYNNFMLTVNDMKYHISWDWQIPVYSKVMPLLKECIKNMDSWDYLYNYYHKIKGEYLKAIYNNDISEGFRIIIDAIRHYNLNKKD